MVRGPVPVLVMVARCVVLCRVVTLPKSKDGSAAPIFGVCGTLIGPRVALPEFNPLAAITRKNTCEPPRICDASKVYCVSAMSVAIGSQLLPPSGEYKTVETTGPEAPLTDQL